MDNTSFPLVSVIIPVYNVEKYISKCIESVLYQSYENYEIILVNDGSTDKSGEICEHYTSKDSRIKVHHKMNGGVSSARNEAMKYCKGKFLTFIDSDDYIGQNFLSELIKRQQSSNADIVIGAETKVFNNRVESHHFPEIIIDRAGFSDLFTKYALQKRCSPWGKLLKSDIIKDNGLKFNEQIHLGEDIIFILCYLYNCNKIAFISSSEYYYIQRVGSLTKKINHFTSEIAGLNVYNNKKNKIIDRFNLNDSARIELSKWGTIFLDRVKISIINNLNFKEAFKLLKSIDWTDLKLYKKYTSKKEY